MDEDIHDLFRKKFSFSRPHGGWPSLSETDLFKQKIKWKIKRLNQLKNELNIAKNRLNDLDLERWHRHTNSTNPAASVIWRVRKETQPEFLTQAWLKMYEILSNYPVIPELVRELGTLKSFHLCEAPGAFITSLNHFLKLHYPEITWDWIATTLNPHHEENAPNVMISDDRFVLLTMKNWYFCSDGTGNIMNTENMHSLIEHSILMGGVLLVTADGSFDCQKRPADQEEMVVPLLYRETVTALRILSAGGTFVLKVFTMYEHQTVCLVYLLNTVFQAVHIFKPVTSKEGNSECYIICLNYSGTNGKIDFLKRLTEAIGESWPRNAMCPLSAIPDDFIKQLIQCCEQFKLYQERVLQRNVALYAFDATFVTQACKRTKHQVAEKFISKYHLQPILCKDMIVGNQSLEKVEALQRDPRVNKGSYNRQREREFLPNDERLHLLFREIQGFPFYGSKNGTITWFQEEGSAVIHIERGKKVDMIRSSKFCSGNLLKFRYQLWELMRKLEDQVRIDTSLRCRRKLSPAIESWLKISWIPDHTDSKINFEGDLWDALCGGDYHRMEVAAINEILRKMKDVRPNENLIIEGWPLLTRLSSGLAFLLSSHFFKVGFVEPQHGSSALIFEKFRGGKHSFKWLELALESCGSRESVTSIIPTEEIAGNKVFYENTVNYNQLTLKNRMMNFLKPYSEYSYDATRRYDQ